MSVPHQNEPVDSLPEAIYYPVTKSQGVMLVTYAYACIEIALDYAWRHQRTDLWAADVLTRYQALVDSWDLPGCRARVSEMTEYRQDFSAWQRAVSEAVEDNKELPDWPWEWANVLVKNDYNADYHELVKRAESFVINAFNRKSDIKNETLRIVPHKSPLWILTIAYSLIVNHLPHSEVKGPAVLEYKSLTEFIAFNAELAARPGPRRERDAKKVVRQTLRSEGYQLRHYSAICRGAEMWYRARVLCEKALEAADYYRIDTLDLSKRIAPYDEATGWPRSR